MDRKKPGPPATIWGRAALGLILGAIVGLVIGEIVIGLVAGILIGGLAGITARHPPSPSAQSQRQRWRTWYTGGRQATEVVMEPSAEPTKQPNVGWRVIITIIGVLLAGFGPILIAYGAYLETTVCGEEPVGCSVIAFLLLSLGVVMTLVGVPFLIAAFVSGTFRQIMVGLGVAAIGGIVVAVILFLISPWAAVLALPAAAGFFRWGYRRAR